VITGPPHPPPPDAGHRPQHQQSRHPWAGA